MDVTAWLRGLDLEQYAQLFSDNDIDGAILCGMPQAVQRYHRPGGRASDP